MADNTTDFPSELGADEQTAGAKKARQAQADQMFGKAAEHAPATPKRADFIGDRPPAGAPPAQGPNVSKEEAEFAANAAANKKADDVPEEKQAAPVQAGGKPLAQAGKTK